MRIMVYALVVVFALVFSREIRGKSTMRVENEIIALNTKIITRLRA